MTQKKKTLIVKNEPTDEEVQIKNRAGESKDGR